MNIVNAIMRFVGLDDPFIDRHDPAQQIKSAPTSYAVQIWRVTWQNRQGETNSSKVKICGFWNVADLPSQAAAALLYQHDIADAHIVALTLDFSR